MGSSKDRPTIVRIVIGLFWLLGVGSFVLGVHGIVYQWSRPLNPYQNDLFLPSLILWGISFIIGAVLISRRIHWGRMLPLLTVGITSLVSTFLFISSGNSGFGDPWVLIGLVLVFNPIALILSLSAFLALSFSNRAKIYFNAA